MPPGGTFQFDLGKTWHFFHPRFGGENSTSTINHERMPVLLTREQEFETWLKSSTDEALALAREYPPEAMRIAQEGFYKEDRLDIAA
jgi:hypothetical protein